MKKQCDLYEGRLCIDCGECGVCDLDPNKVCDNCMACVKKYHSDYVAIEIDEVIESETAPEA